MRMNARWISMAAAAVVAVQIQGCNILPTIPFPVDTGNTPIASFDVVAGVPTTKTATFTGDPSQITPGRGTFNLNADDVTFTPPGTGGKNVAGQIVDCSSACAAAGVDAATCMAVCGESQISITAWIGSLDEEATVCDTGDEYGPFLVELDENGVPVSVSPNSVTLTDDTLELLSSNMFSICVEVIAPDDGTVLIDALQFNLGL